MSWTRTLALAATALLWLAVTGGNAQGKPGACSPASGVRVCVPVCRSDYDCPGALKCCATSCGGTLCSKPVTARLNPAVKWGSCPVNPQGPWVCANRCSVDTDCRGPLKCCRNRCKAFACQRPQP